MAKIILSMDGLVLKELPLKNGRLGIGRKPHNDIQIDNMAISGEHAAIVTILTDSFLEDLDSTNGTTVNGQPVKKHFLQHGDLIELGKYQIKFIDDPLPGGQIDIGQPDGTAESGDATAGGEAAPDTETAAAQLFLLTGPNAGKVLPITKMRTSVGRPGVQVVFIERRPEGFFVVQVDGNLPPIINGRSLHASEQALADRDVLEISGIAMEFRCPPRPV